MTTTLAPRAVELPDLLGTAPADLIDQHAERPVATAAEASARAKRIRAGLVSYTQMRQDIADAYAHRDWQALGHDTWAEYVEIEFGEQLKKLAKDRDERREAVQDLRSQGLSTRQIAAATGVDAKTVRNDLAEVGSDSAPETVTGSDGKTYPATRPAKAERPCGAKKPHPAHEGDYRCPGVPDAAEVHLGGNFAGGACYRADRRDTPPGAEITTDLRKVTCAACLDIDLDDPASFDPQGAYEPDPATRLATVAELAPHLVQPAHPGGLTADVWHCQECGHVWPIVAGEPNQCPACGGRGGFTPPVAVPSAAGTQDSPAGPAAPSPDPRDGAASEDSRPQDRPGTPLTKCETCGVALNAQDARDGYLRCGDCDPNGGHVQDGQPVEVGPAPGSVEDLLRRVKLYADERVDAAFAGEYDDGRTGGEHHARAAQHLEQIERVARKLSAPAASTAASSATLTQLARKLDQYGAAVLKGDVTRAAARRDEVLDIATAAAIGIEPEADRPRPVEVVELPAKDVPADAQPEPEVWIARRRRGIDFHAPGGDTALNADAMTTCGRSMRTGVKLRRTEAADLGAEPCAKCWPPDQADNTAT